MTGAALLTAWSALGSGAGSVSIICPKPTQPAYAGAAPGILTFGIGEGPAFITENAVGVLEYAERFDVLAVGPGLGTGVGGFVRVLLERWAGPLVLDADGINALPNVDLLRTRNPSTIVTPHAGEFRRLTGRDAGYSEAFALARETGATVLLKGNPTFVAGNDLWVVDTGGPELATIGTGDVLAGMAAAFVAGGLPPDVATRSAAFWHGRAGAALAERENVTATTLAEEIRKVVR
jgi:NAD(P)H-hydrate epimerase